MSLPLANILFFSISLTFGIIMIIEGFLIVLMKKQIMPLPTRILVGLSAIVVGSEKSRQQFSGKASPKNLRSYASAVLVFGSIILISCFVYLFTSVL